MNVERNRTARAKVLIVDDSEDNRLVLADALDEELYDIREAVDGHDCLRAVADDLPDLILLDILMPGLDGIECCRRLKASPRTRQLPIILVTALAEDRHVIDGLNAGATDYVAKPFARAVVRARVGAALRSKLAHDRLRDQHEQIIELAALLERKNATLAELTATAHRFVDNVAHEFRTPLSVIKEFASIIADGLGGPVTGQQREYVEFIATAARDLARMVDDFLDSSKLKARTLRIDRCPHDVVQVFDHVEPMLTGRAAQKRITLERDVDDATTVTFADAEKVSRILVNLAVNAIKFSPEGSVVRLSAAPAPDGGTTIAVTDQGPGLSAEDAARVFERFRQVGDVDHTTKGFGLGLSIARELIWLNLGAMAVETGAGEGSTFSFTLPPHDPSVILERYLERLGELDEKPLGLAVLRARGAGGRADAEDIRRFLASVCYPMDLVLRSADGDSVIVLGSTSESGRWIERLRALVANRSSSMSTVPDVALAEVGTWSFADAASVTAAVLPELALQNVAERTGSL